VRNGRVRTLLDLRRRVRIDDPDEGSDQRGLLSIAFAPDWRRRGRLYVDYVGRRGRLRVDEWTRRTRRLRRVLDLGVATTQHHGGQLQFGPDGRLYVSTGMGATPEASQDPGSLKGKLLRVDPRARPARVEVVALGLRNPWRFSFDRRTGRALIGDVGEHAVEEVDVLGRPTVAQAVNFGWPAYEGFGLRAGFAPFPSRAPSLTHRHGPGWCSLVGGYVGRGRAPRALRGRYLYGDVCTGHLWSARLAGRRLVDDRRLGLSVPYLVSFGQDARGRLYAVSLFGDVFRLR
jgi:hypothetical protein